MSYFTHASTEYDLPHPTLGRHQPRFYIPDRSSYSPGQSSAALPGETLAGFHSRQASVVSVPYSGHSTPYGHHQHHPHGPSSHSRALHGSGSRASLAALRHALHNYHTRYDPPAAHANANGAASAAAAAAGTEVATMSHSDCIQPHQPECEAAADVVPDRDHDWDPEVFARPGGEPLEALIDIHRVLYRGMEDPGAKHSPEWAAQGKEVKRVVERWFEGDCVYDHPLIRLSSRQSVLTHFALLQLFSTAYVPSFTPSSILLHARNLTSRIRGAVLGSDDIGVTNRAPESASSVDRGKRAVDPVDEWLASSGPVSHRHNAHDGWWKLWDVSAECRDIGCMECYEGYHVALIDHVVSLTLFPSILRRQSRDMLCPSESDVSLIEPPRSFIHSLAASVLREFDFLLHWDLPISTIVEFNEVGKATHVRDVVDVLDVIDTFVPFAKRFSWLSRRVAGLVTSTVGSLALNFIPGHTVVFGDALQAAEQHRQLAEEAQEARANKIQPVDDDKPVNGLGLGLGVPIGLDAGGHPGMFRNSLGLEGMSSLSMAPDVDGESQDA